LNVNPVGIQDELTGCGLVGGPPGYLPPDPVTGALRRLVWFTVPRALEPRLRAARDHQ
jgi:hypothetical protein